MKRSSGEPTDSRDQRPWRVLTSIPVLMTLGVVVGVEASLHLRAIRTHLPDARIYYSNHVEPRLRALRGTIEEEGRVDMLFVGSSIVRTNVPPLTFDSTVRARGGPEIVSFNGGLSGLPPAGVLLYLEHFFLPRTDPRVVVQGIRYPEILRSEPAEHIEALGHGIVEPLWIRADAIGRAEAWAWENVELLRHRGLLARVLEARGTFPLSPSTYPIDARGWNRRDSTIAERIALNRAEVLEPHPPPADPEDLNRGIEILRRTADLVRSRNADYVLVNVPEHGDVFADPEARDRYRGYVRRLHRFAETEGIRFIDVTDGDPDRYREDAWYYDGHHMSAEGARNFTLMLARHWLETGKDSPDPAAPRPRAGSPPPPPPSSSTASPAPPAAFD